MYKIGKNLLKENDIEQIKPKILDIAFSTNKTSHIIHYTRKKLIINVIA